jgi:hypothetical protein
MHDLLIGLDTHGSKNDYHWNVLIERVMLQDKLSLLQ